MLKMTGSLILVRIYEDWNNDDDLFSDNLNARRDDPTLPAGRGRFISESTQGQDSLQFTV